MLEGLAPGLPDELVDARSSAAPRECRCTRSRRSACSRTAACSSRRGRATPSKGTISESGRARDAPGAGRLAPRRSLGRGAVAAPGRLGARPVVHRPAAAAAVSGVPESEVTACSTRWSPSRCWPATTTRARPSADSTSSSRRCCARSRTGRCRAARARRGTWRRRATSSRPGRARRRTSPRCWRRTTWRRSGPIRMPRTSSRCGPRRARRLTAAGRAAASLALGPRRDRYFEQAAELAENDLERAGLFEQAGRALWHSGEETAAEERLRAALALYERRGRPSGASAARHALERASCPAGRLDEARKLLEPFRTARRRGGRSGSPRRGSGRVGSSTRARRATSTREGRCWKTR